MAISNSTLDSSALSGSIPAGGGYTITNSTCVQSDIVNDEFPFTVTNSIFFGCDCSDLNSGTSGGGNVTTGSNCGFFTQPSDQANFMAEQLRLVQIADNGGPTETFAILPGSVAVNAGENDPCPATDQRGIPRDDGLCDAGAFELPSVIFIDGFETVISSR